MRWLILKDLRILRRSPLLVALLVLYPVVLAVLIGLALSAGPAKPRVAFANLVPPGQSTFSVGGRSVDAADYASRLFASIDPIRVRTRAEAIAKVRSGEALGALVLPADATQRLRGSLSLDGGQPPTVEVYYNAEDPVKRQFVESTIRSRLAEANSALSDVVLKEAAGYIDIVVRGGKVNLPIVGAVDILGLERSRALIDAAAARLPHGDPARVALEQVSRFARLAAQNLDVSKPILATIGSPVHVKTTVINGSRTPLDAFAAAVAVTVSLMFVTLLLAAGLLALEREEHAFARLVRGLVTRTQLLAAKTGLAALCAGAVTLLMLAGLAAFIGLDWGRAPLWVAALALGSLAFAAMGVAVGALAREVRAASLMAFGLSLPIAFLALVPSGAVAGGLYDAIRVISALFPFKPALDALDAAISGGALGVPLLHLAILALAFGGVARVSLRRFAT
ncbi:MAG: type transport system permease protein [Solirubrobacteraceae bacterium]|jgi:ABC-2 type transport system permease protein|nr:type transport system permease protein [Solirubrobacteraceae bacterium]